MPSARAFDAIFERHRSVLLSATVKSEQEALQNPIESFRVAILSSFVDAHGNPVIVEDPYADLAEFIATARINEETVVGTEPDGTVVVDGRSEL